MERRRKKETLSHGPSYNRLHGAIPTPYGVTASVSSPEFGTRPRVRFDERVYQYEEGTSKQGMRSSQRFEVDSIIDRNVPSTSSYQMPEHSPLPGTSEHNQRLASFGVSVLGVATNGLVAYPCLVLRRQCQINHVGRKYHLTPFSLLGPAINMQRAQGLTCLWKGIGSRLWVNAITIGAETVLDEMSNGKLPKEISNHVSLQSCFSHIALKTIVAIITSPFYSAHLIESVQSEMTSESPGLFSCLREGFCRFFGIGIHSQRIIPFYRLIIPTVLHSVSRYILSSLLEQLILNLIRKFARARHEHRMERMQPRSPVFQLGGSTNPTSDVIQPPTPDVISTKSMLNTYYPEMIASFVSELICDLVFYPFETVLHRIHVQGTRTIIDNTDTGRGFLAVSSRYEGYFDCLSTTISHEGYFGLYRGFGALVMQYSCKYVMLCLTKFALTIASNEN